MRPLGIKTQFIAAVAFMFVFALGVSVSQWLKSNAESEAAVALHQDLAVAIKLPRLKSLFYELDLLTFQYLKTGNPLWLDRRREVIELIEKTQADLSALLSGRQEQRTLMQLDQQLDQHLKEQKVWLRDKLSNRFSPQDLSKIESRRYDYEDALEVIMTMHDVRIEDFPGQITRARRASRRKFFIVLAVGFLASALLAFFLSRYIINPIVGISRYTETWKLGQPWDCRTLSASPEIDGLVSRIKSLMETLNAEYKKEKDIGRFKSQMVSMVSHEINNALSVIYAAAMSLEDTDTSRKDERREKMYRILKAQSLSLAAAVGNLLNIGRLESGHLALSRKKMEIESVLRAGVDLMDVLAENKGINLSLSLPEVPSAVYADADALALVVTNLLSNAVKYTPQGGTVAAGTMQDDKNTGFIRVFVRDTGIGLNPEEKERIFSGYYRSERGKKLAKGFGVGLSLAKGIIEAHGSELEVESEQGKGSIFSFLLPLWTAAGEAESAKNGVEIIRSNLDAA
ncbi:MAG: sensor histidine kinase [Elusimicrobiota bacterium]